MFAYLSLGFILLLQFAAEGRGAVTPTGPVHDVTPTTTATPKGISITSNTNMVQPGLTRDLTVTCTFPKATDLNLASTESLVMSQQNNDKTYKRLASIDVLKPLHAKELSPVGARMSGRLDQNGASFLKLEWTYPSKNNTGVYLCEANSLDKQGHGVMSKTSIKITSQSQDMQSLVDAFRKFTKQQDATNRKLVAHIQKQNVSIQSLRARARFVERSVVLDFHVSAVSAGRQYLLSRTGGSRVSTAEALCNSAGGHLADVRSQEELDVIRAFVQTLPVGSPQYFHTYFSPTDAKQEGHWVYRHSGEVMTFTDLWADDAPSNSSSYNCAILSYADWRAHSASCLGSSYLNFICERQAVL